MSFRNQVEIIRTSCCRQLNFFGKETEFRFSFDICGWNKTLFEFREGLRFRAQRFLMDFTEIKRNIWICPLMDIGTDLKDTQRHQRHINAKESRGIIYKIIKKENSKTNWWVDGKRKECTISQVRLCQSSQVVQQDRVFQSQLITNSTPWSAFDNKLFS